MDMSLGFCRLLCTGLLVAGAAASAQTLTLSFSAVGAEKDLVVGSSACADSFAIHWRYIAGGRLPCSSGLQVWVSSKSCSDTESRKELFSVGSSSVDFAIGSRAEAFSNLPGFGGQAHCGEQGILDRHSICAEVALRDSVGNCNNNPEKISADPLSVVYKTTLPPAPVITGAEGYDGHATIHFSARGEYLKEIVLWEVDGDEKPKSKQEDPSRGFLSVSGLADNVPYQFYLKAIDLAGNESPPSEAREVTTIPTQGFWEIYKQNGGAGGGCHSAGQGSLAALALLCLGFCLLRRPC